MVTERSSNLLSLIVLLTTSMWSLRVIVYISHCMWSLSLFKFPTIACGYLFDSVWQLAVTAVLAVAARGEGAVSFG